jgi:alkylation response protein AidB-like acyl-CoA dehydrogenase
MKTGYIDNSLKTETPNFLTSLESGRLRWDLLHPFPEQDPEERRVGDALVAEVGEFLESDLDAGELDRTGEFPLELVEAYKERGYHKLLAAEDVGGRALPYYTVFRFIERVASRSVPAAQVVGLTNTAGAQALLPVLSGPLRDYVRRRVEDGIICAFGDTDPQGQNNRFVNLTVTPAEDGSGYVINGRKLFTANGPITDLIVVSATLVENGERSVAAAFVETSDPGFSVVTPIQFLGSKGLPNAALRFDDIRVPRERVLKAVEEPELAPRVGAVALVGRVLSVGGPATALARNCLAWSRDFARRRRIDGRGLGDYDEIQRILATSMAEVFAVETVVQWCLLGPQPTHRWFEQLVTKNISTTHAWRTLDRTMSLMGGEGFETEHSKRRRGADPIPLERAFRDARGLRIVANVDFQLDNETAHLLLNRLYRGQADPLEADLGFDVEAMGGADLNPANLAHLEEAARQVRRFAETCWDLVRRHPDPAELLAKENLIIQISRVATELFTMCAVLSRTSLLAGQGTDVQELADIVCTEARHRLAELWRRLSPQTEPDYAGTSRALLAGDAMEFLHHR